MTKELLCYESVKPHLKNLRLFGFYQIDPQSSKVQRFLHRVYMGLILFIMILYTFQQIMKIYQERNNIDKVMDTMFLMLTNTDFIYKEFILWIKQDQIEGILDVLKGPLFNQNVADHEPHLLQRCRQAKFTLRLFNNTAYLTCLLWVIYPTILFVKHSHVEFGIYLPFDPNKSPQFYLAVFYVWVQTSVLASGNTSADAFISCLFAQCKTQLTILRLDLENLVHKCKKEAKDKSVPFDEIFQRYFAGIMLHYNEIVRVCYETQNIFGGAIFYFFLISAWIICTSVYRLISINPTSVEFASMILYLFCILLELFLYCFYGNEVVYESNRLLESAFAMDWYDIPVKNRYSLIIFMERIKRPIIPMAGMIIPLSSTTFVSILRSSYTFYAFLKNTE